MEIRRKVSAINVDYKCPKCNNGFLRPTGLVLASNPPLFPHECNNKDCNYKERFHGIKYPYIDYVVNNQNNDVYSKADDV